MRTLRAHIGVDGDPEEIDRLTVRLRREQLALDVVDVRPATVRGVPGAKGDASSVGTLVLGLADSVVLTALVTGICQVLKAWVIRQRDRRVVLADGDRRLELTGVTVEQHDRAIEAFTRALEAAQNPALDGERDRST